MLAVLTRPELNMSGRYREYENMPFQQTVARTARLNCVYSSKLEHSYAVWPITLLRWAAVEAMERRLLATTGFVWWAVAEAMERHLLGRTRFSL